MSSNERIPVESGMSSVRPILTGVLSGIVLCMICLLAFAGILSSQNIPQALIEPMATFSVSLGGFAVGLVCTKITRSNGLAYGLISGAVLAVVVMLASFGFSDAGLGIPALFKSVFILLSSAIGGVVGVNTRQRKKAKFKSKK